MTSNQLTFSPIRKLIGELACIADLRRALTNQPNDPSSTDSNDLEAKWALAEQQIIDEIRSPSRSMRNRDPGERSSDLGRGPSAPIPPQ